MILATLPIHQFVNVKQREVLLLLEILQVVLQTHQSQSSTAHTVAPSCLGYVSELLVVIFGSGLVTHTNMLFEDYKLKKPFGEASTELSLNTCNTTFSF